MTIDWPAFTPVSALAGGALIGAAAAIYLLLSGRIAGITGILAAPLLALQRRPLALRRPQLLFVLGLVAAPLAWVLLWVPLPAATLEAGGAVLAAAGLLVGVATWLANGCTSGHGVGGLARRSLRSLVGVLVFMAAAFATVFEVRHVLAAGLRDVWVFCLAMLAGLLAVDLIDTRRGSPAAPVEARA